MLKELKNTFNLIFTFLGTIILKISMKYQNLILYIYNVIIEYFFVNYKFTFIFTDYVVYVVYCILASTLSILLRDSDYNPSIYSEISEIQLLNEAELNSVIS
jgi:hypothetical protein